MRTTIKLLMFYTAAVTGNIPPIGSSFRITNTGNNRVTNSGDFRVAQTN